MHTWEELCREWLLGAGEAVVVPFLPDKVGSTWTKNAQVDVVGINTRDKTLYLGECKWRAEPVGKKTLESLLARTDEIVSKKGDWRVYYLGFSQAGWTEAAREYAQKTLLSVAGNNWEGEGGLLLDLEQVERDLVSWAK